MDFGSILAVLALTLGVFAVLARPFRKHLSFIVTEEDKIRSSLLAEQDQILESLAELDFDNHLGKIPEKSYAEQRKLLLNKGVGLMKELEDMGESIAPLKTATAPDEVQTLDDDDLEAMITQHKKIKTQGGFCPNCGESILAEDSFCTHCGTEQD